MIGAVHVKRFLIQGVALGLVLAWIGLMWKDYLFAITLLIAHLMYHALVHFAFPYLPGNRKDQWVWRILAIVAVLIFVGYFYYTQKIKRLERVEDSKKEARIEHMAHQEGNSTSWKQKKSEPKL